MVVAVVELVLIAALLTVMLYIARFAQAAQRAHARREDLLLNQVLHLAGRTWQPPPSDNGHTDIEPDDLNRYSSTPSQLLDDEE